MAPVRCSFFIALLYVVCNRNQSNGKCSSRWLTKIYWIYRKCFMHCDILIYSYSSVSISQCNFGDSPRANFLFTQIYSAICILLYFCSSLSARPQLKSILIWDWECGQSALGHVQTIRHPHIFIVHTNMLWYIERFGMQYKKRTFRWMMVVFDFEHKIERVQPCTHWWGSMCVLYCRFRIGSVVLSVNSLNVLHRSYGIVLLIMVLLRFDKSNQTSTLAYLTESHFMHHRFESTDFNMDVSLSVCVCSSFPLLFNFQFTQFSLPLSHSLLPFTKRTPNKM